MLSEHLQLRQISNPSCTTGISFVDELLRQTLATDDLCAQWCFDITTHSWERFDTKLRPSARSGHRLAAWKHLIFLFGVSSLLLSARCNADGLTTQGFQDTGVRTSYLSDLWVWDTLEYKWHQIDISDVDRKPGFVPSSPPPCPAYLEGPTELEADSPSSPAPKASSSTVRSPPPRSARQLTRPSLAGGYTKTYEGKRVKGMALNDTWLLKIPPTSDSGVMDYKKFKWEKRKKVGYAPSTRSGCTMALWSAKKCVGSSPRRSVCVS